MKDQIISILEDEINIIECSLQGMKTRLANLRREKGAVSGVTASDSKLSEEEKNMILFKHRKAKRRKAS